jgi:hypothetical protein
MIAGIRYEGGRRADIAIAAVIVAAVAATLALVLAYFASPRVTTNLAAADIAADSGSAYVVRLRAVSPIGFRILGDIGGDATASTLQLRENGRLLGPAHIGHPDIREKGGGRYSHWGTSLWFSASDSTDPRINGRTYSIVTTASVNPLVTAGVILFDLFAVLVTWRWLAANKGFRHRLVGAVQLLALVLAGLVAAGVFHPINDTAGPPKDAALVVATLGHALAGCAILLAQWAAGAGLARLMLGKERAAFADVLLLGFALSLPFAAVFAVAALAIPYGLALATVLWLLCCLPLCRWRPGAGQWRDLARAGAAIAPFAIVFGCWIGFLWHGPTDTLSGSPSGDQTYYSTSIVSLAKQLYPYLNLGYEHQPLGLYFNMLFPLLGAAFSRLVSFDPFLFIAAGGAATFILALGLTLHIYIRGTGILLRGPHAAFASAIFALTFLIANRYPFWIVESIPMIHAVPLVVVVVYWARKQDAIAKMLAFAIAVVGSALSKVVGAAVLASYVAAVAMPRFFQMSRGVRTAAVLAAAAAAAYAAYLLYRVGTVNLTSAPLGPFSFRLMQLYDAPVSMAWPFVLRDVVALLLAGLAFLLADWLVACVLAGGFLLFLIYPYVFMFEFVCAAIILGMMACDDPQRLWQRRLPVLAAMVPALPAALLTDPAGVSSGLVWLACVGCVVWIVLPRHGAPAALRSPLVAAALLCLGLVAIGRGHVILSSGWQAGVLTPQVRQVWLAVKERTPADALIFTDQTGMEATLLGAWNTYAFTGQRQIFVSNLYMNEVTRLNPDMARAALAENDAILRGALLPAKLKLRGHYSGYFAVVSREREIPPSWVKMFENEKFRLYRIEPAG